MKDIKTRDHVRGIRTIDKAAVANEHMKNVAIRAKENSFDRTQDDGESASDYSAQQIQNYAADAAHDVKDTALVAQHRARQKKKNTATPSHSERGRQKAKRTIQKKNQPSSQNGGISSSKHIKTRNGAKTVKQKGYTRPSAKKGGIGNAAAQKQASASTRQAAAKAQYMKKVVAKQTSVGIKRAATAAKKYAAMIIAKAKSLIAALAAGGSTAGFVILIICMVGLIVASSFGILFSGEDTGSDQTLRDAISEINQEYEAQLDTIRANNAHDVVEMSGSRAVWRDVLSVYAVRTTTDPNNPQEVVTMDDSKKQILKDIFWEMNAITSRVQSETRTVTTETADADGNITVESQEVTQNVLYITVTHKTPEEMAASYSFNQNQNSQLAELLSPDYASLWNAALYGITASDTAIVDVARSQIGNVGGQPYWSWYGFNTRVAWCACFVSWCANECGYIDNGIIPKYSYCPTGADWFKSHGQWAERDITPEPGMIIFFDWASRGGPDGETDHTGIVEKVENGRVYTIEGNSSNSCREKSYPIGWYEIYGYGIPAY